MPSKQTRSQIHWGRHRWACAAAQVLALFCWINCPGIGGNNRADAGQPLLKLSVAGRELEGTPLAWDQRNVVLLDREGRLWDIDPRQAQDAKELTGDFRSHTPMAMQSRLREEFGSAYDVTSTGHYLVVHPRGQATKWSRRFEELYRSFVHYFAVRGFALEEPQFPLVAVVFPDRTAFARYARSDGQANTANVLGYYSPRSNRVALFEQSATGGDDWNETHATVIHEVTHQMAFNTGVHNRYTAPPRWVAEGLGTLFEAPGIWNSRVYTKASDRVNVGRWQQFKQQLQSGKRGEVRFAELISSDRMFDTDADAAYAEAWAFTHFLVETQPRQFSAYVKRTAQRPDFTQYTSAQRMADFTAVFGENLRLLDAQFLRHVNSLRK